MIRRPPRSTLFPLHDALPIFSATNPGTGDVLGPITAKPPLGSSNSILVCALTPISPGRSEEHTSELQSRLHLVCRLLLEKKKTSERAPRDAASDVEPTRVARN